MKVKSSFVSEINSFEAGFKIGKNLEEIKPKLIILFTTTRYENYSDIIEGIKSKLGKEVDIVGMTGDTVYKEDLSSIYGISAIGIAPENTFSYEILHLKNNLSQKELENKLSYLKKEDLKTALIFSHNLSFSTSKFVSEIQTQLNVVTASGFSGSKTSCISNFVFSNEVLQNETVILAMSGNISFLTNKIKGWNPVGETVEITKVEGNIIKEIGGLKALDFYEQRLDRPLDDLDLSLFPLAVFDFDASFVTVSPVYWDLNSREMEMPVELKKGQYVTIALASIDGIQDEIEANISKLTKPFFKPYFGFLFSDFARKIVLGGKSVDETKKIDEKMNFIPLIGIATSGIAGADFVQKNEYSPVNFASANAVYLFLGEEVE